MVNIFNDSIMNSNFPNLWNMIKIRPIEKKSDPSSPADTRPITINSIFAKILCFILNNQLRHFIEKNNIITQFQSGFRMKHSCTTALIRVTDDIRKSLQKNRVVIMVLFDIKSAYPSVSHKLLLYCLEKIGFSRNALGWVSSFISNKCQYVDVDDVRSNTKPLNCGLLQGDNLSQTFFSIVINEIVNAIKNCRMHLYADDLMIYKECDLNDLNDALNDVNSDINDISLWVKSHGMDLNPSKTQAILISTPRNIVFLDSRDDIHKIVVDSNIIEYSKSVKYLGYIFNNEFSSKDHTNGIIKKVNFSLSKIEHCRRYTPKDARIRIVKNVISPIFDYGSIIYHGHRVHGTGEEEKRLQIAQNSCLRYIFNLHRHEHISPFMKELGLLNLFNRRIFLIACFLHDYLTRGTVPYLKSLMTLNNNNTRAGNGMRTFNVGKFTRTRDERIFDVCNSRLWNDLPTEIRCIEGRDAFRRDLKEYLITMQNNNNVNSQ